MKLLLTSVALFFATTSNAEVFETEMTFTLETELVEIAETDFPSWGNCVAKITASVAKIECENKTPLYVEVSK